VDQAFCWLGQSPDDPRLALGRWLASLSLEAELRVLTDP
jgi:hypothetical protein